jgi:hypothetical protein
MSSSRVANDEDVLVLGDGIERRTRASISAATHAIGPTLQDEYSANVKSRYTVVVRSEKLVHNLSAKALGKGPAQAIVAVLRERIAGIAAVAAPATIKAREVARRAFLRGAPWAMKRYAGGRTGQMLPDSSDRLFNDSGRFAKTLTANASDDAWRINVAANRLSPDTLDGQGGRGGEGALAAIWNLLKDLVPEIAEPSRLMDDLRVRGAIQQSLDSMITKVRGEGVDLAIELVRATIEVVEAIDELVGEGEARAVG